MIKPSLIVKDFELIKDYNIVESVNLGKVYSVNVKLIPSNNIFNLTTKMKLIKNDNNVEKILNVIDDNIIYYDGNIINYDVINLVQDIYITKKVITDTETYLYFNINEKYISDDNIAIIIDGLQYGVNVEFSNNRIVFDNNNNIINLINLREKYMLVCNLRITNIIDEGDYMLDVTIEDELNTIENLYIDNILIENITQYSSTNFKFRSSVESPSKITHRIERDIYQKLEHTDITETNNKILVVNTYHKYLNENSQIKIDDNLYNIYKLDDTESNHYIKIDKTFDISSLTNVEIVNSYQFIKNPDSGRYYSEEGKILDINLNNYEYNGSGSYNTIIEANIINNEFRFRTCRI